MTTTQTPTPDRPPAAAISVAGLRLALMSARARRLFEGRTPLLCTLSDRPILQVDCASSSHWTRPGLIQEARRLGASRLEAEPLPRGHIARLYERVRLEHGLPEVRRTWRAGLRALRAEPRHVLHGGNAA